MSLKGSISLYILNCHAVRNIAPRANALTRVAGGFGVKGILRLRRSPAKRTIHFAQDDKGKRCGFTTISFSRDEALRTSFVAAQSHPSTDQLPRWPAIELLLECTSRSPESDAAFLP